ncbi:HTH-type transcriptional repressor YvoA [Zhongshania aliphaticivorans]|uniref:HTH-type transcriptional repressor YvoA n=1 Tax=Zhongshania aliphaticivorans TaxID=1470434 RepID=A0A5S9N1Z8_9GAMM|nr:GntR family transcriptional regulator [Zhongshania aliphaticivorans]CAA0081898.1 HTH-type transcriptional repressor YvoA [Zhongshania aliphaticivorans]CAA0084594.1 HTH-type transcriptional repressor YvoA [Zhongshania aliphaticivorans]
MDAVIEKLFSEHDLKSLRGDTPTPLYHQTYMLLKNKILDGSIAFGAKMPTEQHLAEVFGISRITAKRAMDELAGEGLVDRRRGKGTHVTYHYKPEALNAPLMGMLEKLANLGRHTRVKVLDLSEVTPPALIAKQLGLGAGQKAFRLLRVRSSDEGEPFAYYESWTAGIKHGFTRENLESAVRLDVIRDNGIKLTKVEQDLSAIAVSTDVARELEMEVGEPALTLLRQSYSEDGSLVDILSCQYNPRRFIYRMSLGIDEYIGEQT